MNFEERRRYRIEILEVVKTSICREFSRSDVAKRAIALDSVVRTILTPLLLNAVGDIECNEDCLREFLNKLVEVKYALYDCLGVNESMLKSSVIPITREILLKYGKEVQEIKKRLEEFIKLREEVEKR